MPAKSKKQQKFMAAVANNPKFAKKVGVPQSVGEEFMKMKKYQDGGMMAQGYNPRMKSGGKVRGCGMARGGAVRPCKMVKMKGS
jgi:hypothetical protein